MKKLLKYMAVLATSVMAFGCYPDVVTPDAAQIPDAEAFDITIDVNQETNYVTFTLNNKGLVPMWIFGDQNVDKTANTRYAYTQNGISLRFREAGEHQVEVKAYNSSGVSQGSVLKTFVLENTYRDPFNPAPYMKKLAREWVWNSTVDGHFGCGPSTAEPTSWWSCGANEKADWSLYNDTMTFTEDGKYLFNPGEDGKVYVNAGFSALGTSPDGNDFLVDIPAYETTYTVENNWNEAGVEEIWLVLPAGKNLSYIPNQHIYDNPRFLVTELSTKEVKLAADNAPNGDGTISWLYNFVPAGETLSADELLAGKGAEGKVWVMDSAAKGHLACGPSAEDPAGWWSANADEKAGSGMYDDEITFYPDGKYVYNPGADGLLYVNWGVTVIGPNTGAEPDNSIEYETVVSSYAFDGETITLAENTPMIYVPSDGMYATPTFKVVELTENTLKLVIMNEGCYWQLILKARDASADEPEAVAWDASIAANMWAQATPTMDFWFSASDWSGGLTADFVDNGNGTYIVTMPEGMGSDQWQGQVHFESTGIATSADKKYDFQVVLLSSEDHPGATIKFGKQGDDNTFYCDGRHPLVGGEEFIYQLADVPGKDIDNIKFSLDFAGGVAGSTVEISQIIICEHQDDHFIGAAPAPDPLDPSSDANLWKGAAINITYWFADNGWGQIADPELTQGDNEFKLVIPEGIGASQWQGQFVFNHTGIVLDPAKKYDFQVTLLSSEDHPHVTIKPCYQHPTELDGNGNPADVNELFMEGALALSAYEECVYTKAGLQGTDIPDLKLVFDFGGAVGGSEIVVSGITIQEHID